MKVITPLTAMKMVAPSDKIMNKEDIGLKEIESKLKGLNKELEELIEAVRKFRQKLGGG